MEEKVDRRVRRTKRRLKAALFELVDERGYEAITIRDLTERADVGRSTFYSHYGSKEDLLFAGFDCWLLALAEGSATGLGFVGPLLEHARAAKPFFRATIADGADPRVRRRTIEVFSRAIRIELARNGGRARPTPVEIDPEAVLDARSRALAGALLGLVGWWLEEAEWVDAPVVEELFAGIVEGGGGP